MKKLLIKLSPIAVLVPFSAFAAVSCSSEKETREQKEQYIKENYPGLDVIMSGIIRGISSCEFFKAFEDKEIDDLYKILKEVKNSPNGSFLHSDLFQKTSSIFQKVTTRLILKQS